MLYFATLVFAISVCFGLQSAALKMSGGRTIKSESNYFSSIARIQTGVRTKPDVYLLGSSRIARLPTGATEGKIIGNLGCDGGSAVISLRAIDQGALPSAPIIVIEGNTLLHDLEGRGKEVGEALRSPWFQLEKVFPSIGATSRPSAIVYSRLWASRIGTPNSSHRLGPPLPVALLHPTREIPLPDDSKILVKELEGILTRLSNEGTRILIVMLPPASPSGSPNWTIPMELARVSDLPVLDLTQNLLPGDVTYTDGIHMAPESATAALDAILIALDNLPQPLFK